MTSSSSPLSLDPARLIAFPPSSLDQLVVVTSGARLLKLSASSGQLLSEVGVAYSKQTGPRPTRAFRCGFETATKSLGTRLGLPLTRLGLHHGSEPRPQAYPGFSLWLHHCGFVEAVTKSLGRPGDEARTSFVLTYMYSPPPPLSLPGVPHPSRSVCVSLGEPKRALPPHNRRQCAQSLGLQDDP